MGMDKILRIIHKKNLKAFFAMIVALSIQKNGRIGKWVSVTGTTLITL